MNVRSFRVSYLVAVLSIVALSMAFATGQAESSSAPASTTGPVKIWMNTLWHSGDAQAAVIMIKKFNETHKNIQVDLQQGSWTEYNAQLKAAVVAGQPPQIGTVLNFDMPAMYAALTPLNASPDGDLLQKYGFKGSEFVGSVWDIGTINGNQYGIPLDNTMMGIFYNKDIFTKAGLDPNNPPKTMAEFDKAATAIKAVGDYAFHPGAFGQPRWYRRFWYVLLWQNGGRLIDLQTNKAAFNTPAGLEALKYLVSIREKGWNEKGTNGEAQFEAGKLGMMFNGTWDYLTLAKTKLNWGMMGMPTFYQKDYTWGSNHFLVIPKQPAGNDKLLAPAMEVIQWYSKNSYLWGEYGGHVPMRKSALENSELRSSETWQKTLKTFTDMAFNGVYHPLPVTPKIDQINNAIQPYIQEAYNGTITPQEALNKAEADVNAVLAQQ